jgi:hypothetical protein
MMELASRDGDMSDNPVWHPLCDTHAAWAQGTVTTKWYPKNMAPFIAVPESVCVLIVIIRETAMPRAYPKSCSSGLGPEDGIRFCS